MPKPNCYHCKHRRDLPGDAHSRCAHPRLPRLTGLAEAMAKFYGGTGRGVPPDQAIRVTGTAHGIRNGWFVWPVNFDPVWLETCDGFEAKEVQPLAPSDGGAK